MGIEMSLARLVAPHFGASMPVWALLISSVLLSISLGYVLGGRTSVRRAGGRLLGILLLGAGVLAGAMALLGAPMLGVVATMGRDSSLVAGVATLVVLVCSLTAILVALGMVIPMVIRLAVTRVERSGWVAGRVHATATAGSLMGTLIPAFWWLPAWGTRATLLVIAFLCMAGGLWVLRRGVMVAAAGLLCGLAGLALPDSGPGVPPRWGRLLLATDTPHYRVVVTERADRTRELRLNAGRSVQSLYDPRGPSRRGSWPLFLLAQELRPACHRPPRNALVIGLAAGTLARDLAFAFPGIQTTGVELDGELVQVGRRLFGLPPKTAVEVMDGRRFLELSQTRYDLIMLDAYRDIYVPFHLTTREFFHQVRRRLAPGGAVAINLLAWRDEQSLVNAVAGTLGSAFDHVVVLRRPPMLNVMLYAYNGRRASGPCHRPLHPTQQALVQRLRPKLRPRPKHISSALVLTDDRAPIERLTHRLVRAILMGDGEPGD